MYRVRNLTHANVEVPFVDGYTVVFKDFFALVPDKYVDYFKRISSYDVQAYVADVAPAELPVPQMPKPQQAAQEEAQAPMEQETQTTAPEAPATQEAQQSETESVQTVEEQPKKVRKAVAKIK